MNPGNKCNGCQKFNWIVDYAGFKLCGTCLPNAIEAMTQWLMQYSCYEEIRGMNTAPSFSKCAPKAS